MAKPKIRVGVVGAGNCFAGLYQGLEYYRTHQVGEEAGLMHPVLGGYQLSDIEFVSAFDVAKNKVGRQLHEAAYASPNAVRWLPKMPPSRVVVQEAPVLDGLGIYVLDRVKPVRNKPLPVLTGNIKKHIEKTDTRILLSYLPVGSAKASRYWAQMALDTGCALVNCIPEFIASDPIWSLRFEQAGLPILGDDIKAQVGSTIVHRTLAKLVDDRGAAIDTTYQINVGGNSVTAEQELLLKINGEIIRTRIGDFVDRLASVYGQKRADGKDEVDMSRTGQKLECFTIDENFNVVTADVSHLVRHRLDNGLYEVETAEGRKIRITADHNVFVLNHEGALDTVPVCQLKEGVSMIAAPCRLPAQTQKEARTISLLPHYKELFAQGIDRGGNLRVHNHPDMKIPSELTVSDEMLSVCGLWLADGSFDRAHNGNLEIAVGNDEECVELIDRFASVYGIRSSVRGQAQVSVRLLSKTMAKIFRLALGLGGNSYTKRVPDWFFGLSERQIALVLRGYVSGDGSVSGKQIRWTTASPGLAEDIRTLFLGVGINSTTFKEDYTRKSFKTSYKSDLASITHGIISSKEDVEQFIEKVGFIQTPKNQRALAAAAGLTKGRTHLIPNIELFSRLGIKSKNLHASSSLRAHIVLSHLSKAKDRPTLEKIRGICDSDTRFLKIKSIRKLEAAPQYVYDLSVPGYQRFVCSNLLVHNTDFLNMKEQGRLKSKRISKTEAVQSILRRRIPDDNIYIGPSDFIPFLSNTKLGFMRVEGRMWADVPFNMEIRLQVDDKANSGGISVDALRCAQIALDRGQAGAVIGPSAYFMKHPPKQYADSIARQMVEDFILGTHSR